MVIFRPIHLALEIWYVEWFSHLGNINPIPKAIWAWPSSPWFLSCISLAYFYVTPCLMIPCLFKLLFSLEATLLPFSSPFISSKWVSFNKIISSFAGREMYICVYVCILIRALHTVYIGFILGFPNGPSSIARSNS